MSRKAKQLAKNYEVPQSRDEADTMIRKLGEARRKIARIEADMNDELALIKEKYEQKASQHKLDATSLMSGIEDWCAANRDELTNGGKVKFIDFMNGDVKWRKRPPKVTLRGVDLIIQKLSTSKALQKYLRVKTEVNKDAILEDPDKLKGINGITIGSAGEDFIVEPFEQEISEAAQ